MVRVGGKGRGQKCVRVKIVAGAVVVAFQFGAHDGHFMGQFGRVELGILHAVSFHAGGEFQPVGGDQFMVLGAILRRAGVDLAAVGKKQMIDRAWRQISCSLEHHVFQNVRQAGLPADLVARTDFVPDAEIHDRRGVGFFG